MGTTYNVFNVESSSKNIDVHEHSNLLDLEVFSKLYDDESAFIFDLTPEQIAMIGAKLLVVASYWADRSVVDAAIKHVKDQRGD